MRKTITFIPGAFRPPTKAHWAMIRHYAGISDKVVIVISAPRAAVRATADPDIQLTPGKSKAILDAFKACFEANNVETVVSNEPSPVKGLMKLISEQHNAVVMIGTSDKGNDAMRYEWLPEKFEDREDIRIYLPSETAYHAKDDMSATDVRNHIGDFSYYKRCLPGGLSGDAVQFVYDVIYS